MFTIQPYGEIDPKFVLEHYNELGDEWILRDDNDNPYLVTVVKNEMKPIITNGWVSFREGFTIEGTQELHAFYLGNNNFWVLKGKTLTDSSQYPTFHSLSTKNGTTRCFNVLVTDYLSISSQLVRCFF